MREKDTLAELIHMLNELSRFAFSKASGIPTIIGLYCMAAGFQLLLEKAWIQLQFRLVVNNLLRGANRFVVDLEGYRPGYRAYRFSTL